MISVFNIKFVESVVGIPVIVPEVVDCITTVELFDSPEVLPCTKPMSGAFGASTYLIVATAAAVVLVFVLDRTLTVSNRVTVTVIENVPVAEQPPGTS